MVEKKGEATKEGGKRRRFKKEKGSDPNLLNGNLGYNAGRKNRPDGPGKFPGEGTTNGKVRGKHGEHGITGRGGWQGGRSMSGYASQQSLGGVGVGSVKNRLNLGEIKQLGYNGRQPVEGRRRKIDLSSRKVGFPLGCEAPRTDKKKERPSTAFRKISRSE